MLSVFCWPFGLIKSTKADRWPTVDFNVYDFVYCFRNIFFKLFHHWTFLSVFCKSTATTLIITAQKLCARIRLSKNTKEKHCIKNTNNKRWFFILQFSAFSSSVKDNWGGYSGWRHSAHSIIVASIVSRTNGGSSEINLPSKELENITIPTLRPKHTIAFLACQPPILLRRRYNGTKKDMVSR